jgi:hypothetical protein
MSGQICQILIDIKDVFVKGGGQGTGSARGARKAQPQPTLWLSISQERRNMLRQLGDEPNAIVGIALAIADDDREVKVDANKPELGVFGNMRQMEATLKSKITDAEHKGQEAWACCTQWSFCSRRGVDRTPKSKSP